MNYAVILQIGESCFFCRTGNVTQKYVNVITRKTTSFFLITGDVAGPGYWTSDLHTENQMNLKTGNAENYLYNFAVNLYWLRFLEASHQLTDKWEQWSLKALNKCNCITFL